MLFLTPSLAKTLASLARILPGAAGRRLSSSAATLANIHLFNWGSTMSHGALAGDIPGIEIGVRRLVDAIVRDLFVADADRYATALQSFSEPDLTATRYYVPPQRS